MFMPSLRWMAIAAVFAAPLLTAKAQTSGSTPGTPASYSALLNRYCVVCHNERLKTAGLLLDKMDVAKVSAIRDECARTVFGLIRKLGIPVNS